MDPLHYLFEQAQPYWREDYDLYNEEGSDGSTSSSPEIVVVQVRVEMNLFVYFAHFRFASLHLSLSPG
jgi:hypothetical protein